MLRCASIKCELFTTRKQKKKIRTFWICISVVGSSLCPREILSVITETESAVSVGKIHTQITGLNGRN